MLVTGLEDAGLETHGLSRRQHFVHRPFEVGPVRIPHHRDRHKTLGTKSRISSSIFGLMATERKLTPVTLAPGRLRLATILCRTGFAPIANTIGIVAVADFAASAVTSPPPTKMRATCGGPGR